MRAIEPGSQLLLRALVDSAASNRFTSDDWSEVLWRARRARVLGRLAQGIDASRVPDSVRDHLSAAMASAKACNRRTLWEIGRIRSALSPLNVPVILLKGSAYVANGLPASVGRIFADQDILVPRESLSDVEKALLANGWLHLKPDKYDQYYYRKWMHELPPLKHDQRGTVLDLHHTILPKTGRIRPDVRQLLDCAQASRLSGFQTLSPEDMVLHSAAHCFQDGDLNIAIRDVVDLRDLISDFRIVDGFWSMLMARARIHNLERPLFYALHYARLLLDMDVPKSVSRAIGKSAPVTPVLRWMDYLVPRAILPNRPTNPDARVRLARALLYTRSHWLRMPPPLAAYHLARKYLSAV